MNSLIVYGVLGFFATMGQANGNHALFNICLALAGAFWLKGLLYSLVDEIAKKAADEIERREQIKKPDALDRILNDRGAA